MKLNKLLLFMNEFACVRAIIFAGVYNRVRLYVRVRMCAFVCVRLYACVCVCSRACNRVIKYVG